MGLADDSLRCRTRRTAAARRSSLAAASRPSCGRAMGRSVAPPSLSAPRRARLPPTRLLLLFHLLAVPLCVSLRLLLRLRESEVLCRLLAAVREVLVREPVLVSPLLVVRLCLARRAGRSPLGWLGRRALDDAHVDQPRLAEQRHRPTRNVAEAAVRLREEDQLRRSDEVGGGRRRWRQLAEALASLGGRALAAEVGGGAEGEVDEELGQEQLRQRGTELESEA